MPIIRLPAVGVQNRALPEGFQLSDPLSDPVNDPTPPLGAVCVIVSVNVDPARIDAELPGVQGAPPHVTLKSPRSTSVGASHEVDEALT